MLAKPKRSRQCQRHSNRRTFSEDGPSDAALCVDSLNDQQRRESSPRELSAAYGYLPTASIKHPTIGALAASEIADPASELPAFVRIGGRGSTAVEVSWA